MKQTLFTSILTTLICLSSIALANAQTSDVDFQSDPSLVLNEIFKAAKFEDYSNLSKLCIPDGSNDGDTKTICELANASDAMILEFISYFKTAYINGAISYDKNNETASVPFWFNHPSGENRCNETMHLVKIEGKWYLSSF